MQWRAVELAAYTSTTRRTLQDLRHQGLGLWFRCEGRSVTWFVMDESLHSTTSTISSLAFVIPIARDISSRRRTNCRMYRVEIFAPSWKNSWTVRTILNAQLNNFINWLHTWKSYYIDVKINKSQLNTEITTRAANALIVTCNSHVMFWYLRTNKNDNYRNATNIHCSASLKNSNFTMSEIMHIRIVNCFEQHTQRPATWNGCRDRLHVSKSWWTLKYLSKLIADGEMTSREPLEFTTVNFESVFRYSFP